MKVSICIPTYEMKGQGVKYLNHSFSMLEKQSFQDFEIIVSDHSITNEIKTLCDDWSPKLNIKYISNDYGRGISSCNINTALKQASGDIIKILFQDDFLYDSNSLETQLIHFSGNYNPWMVTACCHFNDEKGMYNPFYPKYHDNIHYGENTISSPSVLMFQNDDIELFDENLLWLMDVEYYKRLYDKFGLPSICNYITIVNREHNNQVSNTLATQQVRDSEFEYVSKKYNKNANN
jgi:glycosyltransferase involved in cell wall biosynthesis